MSNLYNEEVKNRYLQTYDNEGTKNTIRHVFSKTAITEETLRKDLYNFSLEDLIDAFKNINALTKSVVMSAGRFIKSYISFCIKNGYRDDNLNPLTGIENDWYAQWINKKLKIHYSFEEFTELVEDPALINAQDQALMFLLFEGVKGEQFIELRSLKYEHINFEENEIYIANRNESIKVSDLCLKFLQKAYEQTTYYTYHNGEYKEKELLSSSFLLKNVKAGRTEPENMVSMAVFYNRLNSIKTDLLELEYLTPNAISQSGQIFHSFLLYKKYGKLEYEQFAEIGKKYNLSLISNNGYTYYNTFLIKEYVNSENIKNLYDIDIDF
jgi:integrase